MTFYKAPTDLYGILDIAKACDVLLLVYSDKGPDQFGNLVISSLKAQGIPSIIGAYQTGVKFFFFSSFINHF